LDLYDRRSLIAAKRSPIRFAARFGAEIAFAMDADADRVGVHIALSDNEHGVDFHLLGALDFAVDAVGE
jgi:hypothetical protein